MCDTDPFFTQVLSANIIADIQAHTCRPNPNEARRQEVLKDNFMKMIDSGARLVLGADTGIRPGNAFGSGDHHELEHWVQFGLTPAQIIVAATATPAGALGLKDVGTLVQGANADFIVLNANPLEDIRNTRQIASVYLRGAKLDREALLAKWRSATTTQSRSD